MARAYTYSLILLCLVWLNTLTGCFAPITLYRSADKIAFPAGFTKKYIDAGRYRLLSFDRLAVGNDTVQIYIEGDGNAWRTRYSLSQDPTPRNPLALRLATLDPAPSVVYLARPCQYVIQDGNGKNCNSNCWSTGIFSEEIIKAIDLAISQIKKTSGAAKVNLIGYSGGGAVAMLVAARRNDVYSLRTIAANLDHQSFSLYHKISPLSQSLNPVDIAKKISQIPQLHFVGGKDEIIPRAITDRFISEQEKDNCSAVMELKEVGHAEGWEELWPSLLEIPFPCSIHPVVPLPR